MVAALLLVPTVALAWWSRRLARRDIPVGWIAPVVVVAWLATVVLVHGVLLSSFDRAPELPPDQRSAALERGVASARFVFAGLLGLFAACAALMVVATRRATAARPQ